MATADGVRLGFGFGDAPRVAIVWIAGSKQDKAHLQLPLVVRARWLAVARRGAGAVHLWQQATVPVSPAEAGLPRAGWGLPRSTTHARTARLGVELQRLGLSREAVAPFLAEMAIARFARIERLRAPWFVRVDELQTTLTAGGSWRRQGAGVTVWSLSLRASSAAYSEVEIRSGGVLIDRQQWRPRRAEDGTLRARRRLRVVSRGRALQIDVPSGEVQVEASAYRHRPAVAEWLAVGRRRSGAVQAAVSAALAQWRTPDQRNRAAASRWARDASVDLSTRTLLRWVLAVTAVDATAAAEAASVALAEGKLGSELQLELLRHLVGIDARLSPSACGSIALDAGPKPRAIIARAFRGHLCGANPGPAAIAELSRALAADPADRWLTRVADRLRRTYRWVAVDASTFELVGSVDDGRPDGRCATSAPDRWIVLGPGRHRIDGNASSATFRLLQGTVWEGTVLVDGLQVPIHGAARLPTRLWVPARPLTVVVPPGAPLLGVRTGGTGARPCGSVRTIRRVRPLSDPGGWQLEQRDTAGGWVKMMVTRASPQRATPGQGSARLASGRAILRVRVGDRTLVVELPANGAARFALPVPRDARVALRIAPDPAARDRVAGVRAPRQRRRLWSSGTGDALPASSSTALQWVRGASRVLRRLAAATRRALARRRRAQALDHLGFRTLARLDWARLGRAERPFDRRVVRPTPRGLGARIPPLPVRDAAVVHRAQAALAAGDEAAARRALGPRPARGSAELVLAAHLAERAGDATRAAALWEQTETAAGWSRAAGLLADRGAREGSSEDAVRSLMLAARAEVAGGNVDAIWARSSRRVRWIRVGAMERSAGSRAIALRPGQAQSLGQRVRAALLDAPDDAVVLQAEQYVRVHVPPGAGRTMEVAGACENLDVDPACRLQVRLNGGPWRALPHGQGTVGLERPDGVVEVRPDRVAIAWVRLKTAPRLAPEIVSLWHEARPGRSALFHVAGPTVLRLQLRAVSDQEARKPVSVTVGLGRSRQQVVELAAGASQTLRFPVLASRGQPVRVSVDRSSVGLRAWVAAPDRPPRARPGVRSPSVVSSASRPAVRRFGLTRALPAAGPLTVSAAARYVHREIRELDVAAGGTPYGELQVGLHRSFFDQRLYLGGATLGRFRAGAPTFGARGRVEWQGRGWRPRLTANLGWFSQGSRWALGGRATAVWNIRLLHWLSLHPVLGFRARRVAPDAGPRGIARPEEPDDPEEPPFEPDDPEDAFFEPEEPGDFDPDGLEWVALPAPDHGGSRGQSPVRDTDPDVFTRYDHDHPYFARAGLTAYARPLRDIFLRLAGETRTNADFGSLDRVDGRLGVDFVPGWTLLPSTSVGYRISRRLTDTHRRRAFVQHRLRCTVELWQKWWRSSLFSLGLRTDWVVEPSLFGVFVTLRYLWAPGRGLRDFSERQIQHRAAREQNAMLAPEFWR